MLKTCKILLILIVVALITAPNVLASDIGSILEAGQEFLQVGDDPEATINSTNLGNVNSNIFNIFFAAAIIIAVVIGIVLGIQFMTSSVEGQAKVKEAVVPYLIGCVIVFVAFPIWKIVVGVGESTEKDVYTEENGTKMAERIIEELKADGGTYGDLVEIYQGYYKNNDINDYYKALNNELEASLVSYAEKGGIAEANVTDFKKGLIYGFISESEKKEIEKKETEESDKTQRVLVYDNWYKKLWIPLQKRPLSSIN